MTINWYGYSCFKIIGSGGQLTVFTDPFDKSIGLNPPRGNADIVTVSHNHSGHNNIKSLSGDIFLINNPGEYEKKGIKIIGVSSFHDSEEKELNSVFVIEVDRIKICHLGDLGQAELTAKQVENISSVDILLVPVGGKTTIDAKQAIKIIEQIEPKMVIPMHYKLPGLKSDLADADVFLKEVGMEKKPAVEKLTLKKKDLPSEGFDVVLMKA